MKTTTFSKPSKDLPKTLDLVEMFVFFGGNDVESSVVGVLFLCVVKRCFWLLKEKSKKETQLQKQSKTPKKHNPPKNKTKTIPKNEDQAEPKKKTSHTSVGFNLLRERSSRRPAKAVGVGFDPFRPAKRVGRLVEAKLRTKPESVELLSILAWMSMSETPGFPLV